MNVINYGSITYAVLNTNEDLEELSKRWKAMSLQDSNPEHYTKTEAEATETMLTPEKSNLKIMADIREKGKLPDVSIIDGHPVTIMLTQDGYNGAQWHISLAELSVMGLPTYLVDEIAHKLLNAFFKDWKEIDNPGMMKEIRHFVGND